MIRYTLNCAKGHDFESWFQNSGAFDKQKKRGLVTCPVCGSAKVEKAIMAPRLAPRRRSGSRTASTAVARDADASQRAAWADGAGRGRQGRRRDDVAAGT